MSKEEVDSAASGSERVFKIASWNVADNNVRNVVGIIGKRKEQSREVQDLCSCGGNVLHCNDFLG